MNNSMLQTSKGSFRGIIIALNCVLLVAGAGSVAVGIWLLTAEDSYFYRYHDVITERDVHHDLLRDSVIGLLAGGVAILLFAALGTVAAYTLHSSLLAVYSVLLSILMVLEMVPIILALVFKSDWLSKLDEQVLSSIHTKYGGQTSITSKDFTKALDALQTDFACCGWHNGTDYVTEGVAPKRWKAVTADEEPLVVPESCCYVTANKTSLDHCVTQPASSEAYFEIGCQKALMDLLNTHQILVFGLGCATLAIELVMIASTVILLTCTVTTKYNVG